MLDLYAGSGAIGIEALSRGADHVTFVDSDAAAVLTIRRNLQITGFDKRAAVEAVSVREFISLRKGRAFDLVMLDPPFDAGLDPAVLDGLMERELIEESAVIVVRSSSRSADVVPPNGLQVHRHRRYGDSKVWYLGKS